MLTRYDLPKPFLVIKFIILTLIITLLAGQIISVFTIPEYTSIQDNESKVFIQEIGIMDSKTFSYTLNYHFDFWCCYDKDKVFIDTITLYNISISLSNGDSIYIYNLHPNSYNILITLENSRVKDYNSKQFNYDIDLDGRFGSMILREYSTYSFRHTEYEDYYDEYWTTECDSDNNCSDVLVGSWETESSTSTQTVSLDNSAFSMNRDITMKELNDSRAFGLIILYLIVFIGTIISLIILWRIILVKLFIYLDDKEDEFLEQQDPEYKNYNRGRKWYHRWRK
jgi:hypothetical protein